MFTVLDRNYTMAQQDVENIVYQYTQIAAKKGVLYQSVLDEMDKHLNKYGDYEINITAEKFVGNNEPVVMEGSSTIDAELRESGFDLLSITVIYKKRHPVSIMYEYSVFGTPNGSRYDFTLFGNASSYIR
jgi:hypothetical protein